MSQKKSPGMMDALVPIIFLIILLTLSVYLFGEDSSYGANQIALILSGCLASIIGLKNGYDWKTIEKGIIDGISLGMGAVLILLAVGALIGTWVMSGTVPAMIYYGLNIMSPSYPLMFNTPKDDLLDFLTVCFVFSFFRNLM